MEPLFEVDQNFSRKELAAFDATSRRLHPRVWYIVLFCVMGLLFARWLAEQIRLLQAGVPWDAYQILSLILYAAWFVWFFLWPRWSVWRLWKKRLDHRYGPQVFREQDMTSSYDQIREEIPYSAVRELLHRRGVYYLFLDKYVAIIAPESRFTKGDPAAFAAFLTEKTGLAVREMK